MAEPITIQPTGEQGKIRSPILVAVWTFITIFIYGVVYWYKANKELVILGRARGIQGLGDSPGTSLLAVTLGALVIVPALVSIYRGFQRMQTAQRALGLIPHNGWIAVVLYLLFFPAFLAYFADGMNNVLRAQSEQP